MIDNRPAETIGRAVLSLTSTLLAGRVPRPRLDAELLLGHVLERSRTRLVIDANEPIDVKALTAAQELVRLRITGEPVAYLVGHREFMEYDFAVGPGVLVPRPETEPIVERATELIPRKWLGQQIQVLDLCTGSGAIALSLASMTDPSLVHITGSDVSPAALAFAHQNRERLKLGDRVDLVEGDLLTWTRGPWDLILSNPPYLRSDQIDSNLDIQSEPRLALDGGREGLELIERILDQSTSVVAASFALLIELDPDHAENVRVLATERFPNSHVIIIPDLTGRDRFVSIEREANAQ